MARSIPPTVPDVVCRSSAMRATWRKLERIAHFDLPVLLSGETGVGKDVAARTLHLHSPRRHEPFVAVNCAAIARGVAESELFGHVRGAYTGADRTRGGAFVRAGGGTLLLDEIAELPLELQAKLLRVLENGTFVPVGSDVEVAHRARVVAATCRDLPRMVAEGRFREDLYHRLSVVVLRIPPLRERREDIGPMLDLFAAEAARRLGRPVRITASARAAAERHPWPGNVRALKNAVLRAAALCDGRVDGDALVAEPAPVPSRPSDARDVIAVPRGTYREMQAHLLRHVVAEHGSIRRAAAALAVPRSTLAEWLKRAEVPAHNHGTVRPARRSGSLDLAGA